MQRGPQRRARISDVEKEAIIAWKNAGRTYAEIEGTFHHPISTLQNIVKRAEHQQQNRQRGRRKNIHPVAHAPYITQWLEDDCTITLGELSRRCQVRLGLEISRSTLCRALDQFNYSFKRVTVRDERGETEENNLRRFEYTGVFNPAFTRNPRSFFFMDEVGFSVSMRRAYGYAPRGERAEMTAPAIRSRNLTIMALVGNAQGEPATKLLVWKILPGAGNATECHTFLGEVLALFRERGIASGTIVLDNVRFHHSAQVTALFPPGGPFQLLFLPPYTPDFNPIENVFSKWKGRVRQAQVRNEHKLRVAIASAAANITEDNISNCIGKAAEECRQYRERYLLTHPEVAERLRHQAQP